MRYISNTRVGNPVGGHPHSRPFPSRERVPDFPSDARNNGYAKVSSGEGDLTLKGMWIRYRGDCLAIAPILLTGRW